MAQVSIGAVGDRVLYLAWGGSRHAARVHLLVARRVLKEGQGTRNVLYVYVYTHTHTYIYIYIYTRPPLPAHDLVVDDEMLGGEKTLYFAKAAKIPNPEPYQTR